MEESYLIDLGEVIPRHVSMALFEQVDRLPEFHDASLRGNPFKLCSRLSRVSLALGPLSELTLVCELGLTVTIFLLPLLHVPLVARHCGAVIAVLGKLWLRLNYRSAIGRIASALRLAALQLIEMCEHGRVIGKTALLGFGVQLRTHLVRALLSCLTLQGTYRTRRHVNKPSFVALRLGLYWSRCS